MSAGLPDCWEAPGRQRCRCRRLPTAQAPIWLEPTPEEYLVGSGHSIWSPAGREAAARVHLEGPLCPIPCLDPLSEAKGTRKGA